MGVRSIGAYAFHACTALTDIAIPSKVTSIGEWAFAENFALTSVVIPKSVTSIGGSAFFSCSNLADAYYTGTEAEWNAITIVESWNDGLENAAKHYNYVP